MDISIKDEILTEKSIKTYEVEVTAPNGLYKRQEPNDKAYILGIAKNGEKLVIIDSQNGWLKTDLQAWVMEKHTKKV